MNAKLFAAFAAAALATTPALAVTNLINNGSFEQAGATGVGAFTGWTKTNIPTSEPASVIRYNSSASYPNGAFGESVFPDNLVSGSPDAVGNYAAYFVGDVSVNETISQLTFLTPGNYRVGFSYFLTNNGLRNPNNASLDAAIIGIPVASTMITGASQGRTWFYATGVGQISLAGYYRTALIYNSNGRPAKDIVVDRVFAIPTTDPADVIIPPTPTAIPEPSTWAMLLAGFGLVGAAARRRRLRLA